MPLGQVHHDGFHLEVRADDPTDVENLVAVPNIIKVSWRESLWQMAGEDEASEEGKGSVLVMDRDCSLCAALCHAQVEPVEERDAVEEVRVHEGQDAGSLAEHGPLHLQKPGVAGQAGADDGVEHGDGHVAVVEGAVDPSRWEDVRRVCQRGAQAVHAESSVVEEVADVPGAGGHGAEGVGTAGGQRVDAAGQEVGEEGPGIGVLPAPWALQPPHQGPHEVPGRHKVCPDVECLIRHLEDAEEAICCRAPGRAIPKEDALLLVPLRHLVDAEQPG